ncbi:MAG: precorrin-2 C(20)-methyltransferase [Ardenticatenia bacterium]|nr:precorrin-2 C(20)-methyltransferase [Ardenticatenia bacterium]
MSEALHLTAVGVGPGDPEWITVKGQRVLAEADVIFAPCSETADESVALRIARPWLRPGRRVELLPLPMTRDRTRLEPAWRATAAKVAAVLQEIAAQRGAAHGAYIVLGDPLFYGTFAHIWQVLAARHPAVQVDVVPGVPAFVAAAARAGLPLATTSQRVAIVPATYEADDQELAGLITAFDTVVLLKVGRVLGRVRSVLARLGVVDRALYAAHVGLPEERVVHGLAAIQAEEAPYLSLLIVRREEHP